MISDRLSLTRYQFIARKKIAEQVKPGRDHIQITYPNLFIAMSLGSPTLSKSKKFSGPHRTDKE
ncbi:hypothetical protein [Desulfonema magnum]|uniref:Uncharacterized protein n=1 Tax=Desulfonema magnum TaxID=45655 RepID=A0A975GWC5_9BACT|nr:hypothetical protein [Desulfonema magnum]QTA93853.1 Uncharacterized protein dnm_099610 [Desulfonema magnum]